MKFIQVISASLVAFAIGNTYGADAAKSDSAFAEIDAVIVKPTGLPTDYTLNSGANTNPIGTDDKVEFSNKLTPRITLGYEFASGGAITASYWGISQSKSASDTGANLWDTLYSPSFGFGSYNGTASATADLKAHTLDVAYQRPLMTDGNFSLSWLAGLRETALKYKLDATYVSGGTTEVANYSSDNKGIGLRFGLNGALHYFDNRLTISAGLAYSLIQGTETLGDHQARNGITQSEINLKQKRNFGIVEASLSAQYMVWRSLSVKVGYELNSWQGAAARQEFTDDITNATNQIRRQDVSFNGYVIGVGWAQVF